MATTPRPSGLDLSAVDTSVRIQDDLFGHVNGTWLRDHEIPADRASDGAFYQLRDKSEKDVRAIVEEIAAEVTSGSLTDTESDRYRIGALYSLFMNEAAIEEAGLSPLEPLLREILEVKDAESFARIMASPAAGATVIAPYVWTDDKDSSRYMVRLHQSGLGMPERSYYLEDSYAETREAYRAHLSAMAALSELPGREGVIDGNAEAIAAALLDLETRIAQCHVDVVRLRDREKSYNPMGVDGLTTLTPSFPWDAFIAGTHAPAGVFERVSVGQPEFLEALEQVWASTDLATWKTWLALRTAMNYAPYMHSAMVQENFAFQGTALSGAVEIRERWKRALSLVEGTVGMAVGKVYVDKHFPPKAKDRMEDLVAALMEAYRDSISALTWMGEDTKKKALDKLESFTPKIGYPDTWRTYEGMRIDPNNLVETVRLTRLYEAKYEFGKVLGPVNKDEWHMTPQTVNAYYNPGGNEIVFPAAILQPPMFDAEADDAMNFGGIGSVIGHEIGHGFDDQGSKYDGDGNLVSWWTPQDRAAFENLTRSLIDQYEALTPRDLEVSHHVNGGLTIGENIGDLGGLSIAVKAYLATAEDPEAVIDGFTGLQRVFLSWAIVWRAKVRTQEAIRRLAVDPHSPAEFRCNTVASHIDAFHEAFDVQVGDAMYLEPARRVQIW